MRIPSSLLCILLLSSCAHVVPVTAKFPNIPPALTEDCGELFTLAQDAKLSDLMITITMNYMKFHECKRKNQAWTDWYKEQKAIHDAITKK